MGKRIIPQRRGRGGNYQSPSHRHKGGVKHPPVSGRTGVVKELLHDPGRNAPIMKVEIENGDVVHMLAPEGIHVGAEIPLGVTNRVERGALMKLGFVPDGTFVYNIEAKPGDGGKFVRAGGTHAMVISKSKKVVVQLPSGEFKTFNPHCRAVIGEIAGGGASEKPFAKAGKKFHHCKSKARRHFKVSGVSMNPVDHPHGGGGHKHVGGPSTVSRNAPPGRKVGRLSPKKRSRRKKKKKEGR